ncbi:glycoside hydrolase family 36 protein [Nocardioides sp. zg-1228]|uniref:glycoside hydrolase family 36 protein n=1 Tax=Nocardioides sp. zg-1228 TaxID=2763008 RepID=UPI0016431F8F|nr:glycoside hydrolase family 36 protein [Nocardioides sp. zg-1228]MBC2932955.1 alpha-galactosidase [Nocardioides sp. zg-1228]QSF56844.1 alpha-galactosidase [Nocardioides sp. zg-1228]
MTRGGEVVGELAVDPVRGRVYAEGWQSWSPATWSPVTASPRRPEHHWQHLMRFRPGTPVHREAFQGEGLLVVDPGTGDPAHCYRAAAGRHDVPTVHAVLEHDRVVVRATGDVATTEHVDGGEAALAAYGDELAAARGPLPSGAPPTVWCSWYRYFEEVTADDVRDNLHAIESHDLPVDVVQVDDGWSAGLGEGLLPSARFGSLVGLVEEIRSTGRRAGLWAAPFLVGVETTLARDHADWLVGPAGRNWGQALAGLDLTHPGVQELLVDALGRLTALGIDYLKLDFLYGGAVPGRRHDDVDGVTAYRRGLELVRDAVGPHVYLVGCGAPLLPSVGLVDAMRVSPDTFHEGGEDGSTGLRGLMPMAARAWQHGRLWVNDPDCVVARPTYAHRERWAALAREYGGLRSFSDRVAELDGSGLAIVRRLLADTVDAGTPFPLERIRSGAEVAQREVTR